VFNYSIPLTGGYGSVNATGTIIVNVVPTISVTESLSAFIAVAGTASSSQYFNVIGTDLTGPITISSSAVELSTDNVTYSTALNLTPVNNAISTRIYVRIPATAVAGSWSGTVTIVTPGTTDKNVLLGGTVTAVATTGGDPYVTTFQGLQYKLPNIVRSYRLLEYPLSTGTLFINASISGLSSEEKREIGDGLERNGFFYDQFFVGTQDSYAVLDRQLNLVCSHNLHHYTVILQDTPQNFHCPIQGSSLYVAKIIQVEDIQIELRLFSNPQIRNGIQVAVTEPSKAKGLLSSNQNPKFFSVKQIQCVKPVKLGTEKDYQRVVKEYWTRPNLV
jgi:hypothetical protein